MPGGAAQFTPAGPPALDSDTYAQAFDEVQAIGSKTSTTRTADQTQIALFWADGAGTATPPGYWNQIAQTVAESRHNTVVQDARLFALLNVAMADAGIVAWTCKYQFDLWRPVTAIRAADQDGNPATEADPDWTPLITTPPFPSYVYGHSSFSAAAATILARFFGTDHVTFTAHGDGMPGVTRPFESFSQAAAEAGMSRIYGGIHWQFDNADALTSCGALGAYVFDQYFAPAPRPVVPPPKANAARQTFRGVEELFVDAGGGRDKIVVDPAVATRMLATGSAGNDTLVGGGGILNHGSLTLSGCTVSASRASYTGGQIYSDGKLTVTGCTVSGGAAFYGGAIYNAGGTLVSNHSTLSGNQARTSTTGPVPLFRPTWSCPCEGPRRRCRTLGSDDLNARMDDAARLVKDVRPCLAGGPVG